MPLPKIPHISLFLKLFIVIFLLSGCGGAKDRKEAYYSKGKELYTQANYEKARLDFQNALQIDPNMVSARFMLAQTLEKLNEPRKAAGHYSRVIELDPNQMQAKARLARIYILGGVKNKAKELANDVIHSEPNNSTALTVLASVTSLDGNKTKAIEQAKASLKVDPDNRDTVALLASLYVSQKEADKAIKVLTDSIAKTHDENFRIILTDILAGQKEYNKASDILTDVLAKNPANLAAVTRLATIYNIEKRQSDAEKLLQQTVEKNPDSQDAKMLLVNFIAKDENFDKAETALKSFIKDDPNDYKLRFGLARLYHLEKKYPEEKAVYKQVFADDKEGPDALKAKDALARQYLAENKPDKAITLIDQVLKKNPMDNEGLLLRGLIAFYDKRFDDAISDFRSVLRDQPKQMTALKLIAKAHIQTHEYGLARDNLQTLLDINKNDLEARLELASVLGKIHDKSGSMDQIKKVLSVAPKNINALEMLFRKQVASHDFIAGKKTAKLIKTTYPDAALGYYLTGLIEGESHHTKSSIEQYKLALDKQPTAVEPLNALIRILLKEKETKQALAALDKILKKYPDHLIAMNLKGEVLMTAGHVAEAKKQFESVIEKDKTIVTPYINLARIQLRNGNITKATDEYQRGINNGANKVALLFQIANVYLSAGDNDKAILAYEKLLKEKPDATVAANNLAMLLVSYKPNDKTIKRALDLVSQLKASKNPAYLDTIGWTYYKSGDNNAALPYLDKALAMDPNEPLLLYHTGMSLYNAGKIQEARENLKKSVKSDRKFLGRSEAEKTLEKIASN